MTDPLKFDPPLSAEERRAWDIAVAGALACPEVVAEAAAKEADRAIVQRRARFGDRPGSSATAKHVEDIAAAAIALVRRDHAGALFAMPDDLGGKLSRLVALVDKVDR